MTKQDTMPEVNATRFFHDVISKSIRADAYVRIIEMFKETDVSKNMEFQHLFTWFYRVRRSKEWLEGYYKVFQKLRDKKGLDIETILTELDKMVDGGGKTLELSFASKMLATINTDMPIWDSLVKKNLGLPDAPSVNEPDRIRKGAELYGMLCETMKDLVTSPFVDLEIRKFDEMLPEYRNISRMKKLDFLLWGSDADA